MATRAKSGALHTWLLLAPSVSLLALWTSVPLILTLWFSFQRYNLLTPEVTGFAGLANYGLLLRNATLWTSIGNTFVLVGSVLVVTVSLGVLLAIAFDQDFPGRNVARLLVIAPFFVMPTVGALIWKNLILHPVNGLLAAAARAVGLPAVDWFADLPMTSVIIIVAWQWTPFATLILITAMTSLDRRLVEAARIDGAGGLSMFRFIILPHLTRPIAVVLMVETVFLLSIFAEILVTTSGGPGTATTNLTYFIYLRAFLQWDVGGASAAGVIAIVLANVVAIFLIKTIARNLEA